MRLSPRLLAWATALVGLVSIVSAATPEIAARSDIVRGVLPNGVPDRALVGPPSRIEARYHAWAESGVTGLTVGARQPAAIELMAALAQRAPAVGVH